MVAGNLNHRSQRWGGGRYAEGIALALNDQRGHRERGELADPARTRSTACTLRWLQRKREAEDSNRSGCLRGAAGNTRAGRASAGDEREAAKLLLSQMLDDRHPGGVELTRRRGRAATGDPVGLLDEGDDKACGVRGIGDGNQIGCRDPSSRAVTKDERAVGTPRKPQVCTAPTMRRVDLDHSAS